MLIRHLKNIQETLTVRPLNAYKMLSKHSQNA